MNITIVTVGSRGDIQPYIALGIGLREKGFNVKIITNENFKSFIEAFNISFHPVKGDIKEILNSEAGIKTLESGYSLKFLKHFFEVLSEYFEDLLDSVIEVSKDTDFMIFSPLAFICHSVAEYYGIKSISATLQPMNKTKEFPSFIFPEKLSFIPGYNELSHLILEYSSWELIKKSVNKSVYKRFGKTIKFRDTKKYLEKTNFNYIYGFSKYIIPKPSDWSVNHHVTGYWFLDTQKNWHPPQELINFLDTDKKIIYAGFGSMLSRDPYETSKIIFDSIKNLDIKLIVSTGWGGLKVQGMIDDNVYVTEQLPHDWLFSKINAAIHHCGSGTTSAALKAGIPSIPVPFFSDQPFWANRIYNLGLSTKPINRKDLNSSNLRTVIKEALNNENMINRSLIISDKIKTENGVENSVKIIENLIYNS